MHLHCVQLLEKRITRQHLCILFVMAGLALTDCIIDTQWMLGGIIRLDPLILEPNAIISY